MVRLNLFTYSGDWEVLQSCISCARIALPEAHVIVIDDALSPCHGRLPGVEWRQSAFPRNGNLNGHLCVEGIVHEMINGAEEGDLCVKLDCDTALLSSGMIDRMGDADGFGSYSRFPDQILYGCCYGFRTPALRRISDWLKNNSLGDFAPEDIAMGNIAEELGLCMSMEEAWHQYNHESKWTAYNWPARADVNKYRQFDVVTLGNDRKHLKDEDMVRMFEELQLVRK